jgi:hypothetical protein
LPTLESRTLPALVPLEGQLIAWRGSDVYDDLDAPDPCEGSTQACDPTTPTITEELSDGLRIDLSQFGY